MQPLALGESVKQFYQYLWLVFPAWSILSELLKEGSHIEKSYLTLRRFRRC